MGKRRMVASAAAAIATVAATAGVVALQVGTSDAKGVIATAPLIDNAGASVGQAEFSLNADGSVRGIVRVTLPTDSPEFHGVHLHANADSTGCVAGSGFTGVGGHWDVGGHNHGAHTGDLPSIVRRASGMSELTFRVDKFTAADLAGKAVIVHAGPDNFGNIPLGAASNQYTDNGTAYFGTGGTAATGNAGTRFACGVIVAAAAG